MISGHVTCHIWADLLIPASPVHLGLSVALANCWCSFCHFDCLTSGLQLGRKVLECQLRDLVALLGISFLLHKGLKRINILLPNHAYYVTPSVVISLCPRGWAEAWSAHSFSIQWALSHASFYILSIPSYTFFFLLRLTSHSYHISVFIKIGSISMVLFVSPCISRLPSSNSYEVSSTCPPKSDPLPVRLAIGQLWLLNPTVCRSSSVRYSPCNDQVSSPPSLSSSTESVSSLVSK